MRRPRRRSCDPRLFREGNTQVCSPRFRAPDTSVVGRCRKAPWRLEFASPSWKTFDGQNLSLRVAARGPGKLRRRLEQIPKKLIDFFIKICSRHFDSGPISPNDSDLVGKRSSIGRSPTAASGAFRIFSKRRLYVAAICLTVASQKRSLRYWKERTSRSPASAAINFRSNLSALSSIAKPSACHSPKPKGSVSSPSASPAKPPATPSCSCWRTKNV